MKDVASWLEARRRLSWLLLAIAALWLCHRTSAYFGTRSLRPLATGYTDEDLLAAGGDLALELVLLHETALLSAITTVGVALLAGRLATLVVSFFVFRSALALAWGSSERVRPANQKPLHTGWAIPAVFVVSLLENLLLAGVALALGTLLRSLVRENPDAAVRSFALAALVALALWALIEVWLDLYRLALAGARQRPLAAARAAGRAWLSSWGRLAAARASLAVCTVATAVAGFLLLPVLTHGSPEVRVWALLALEAGMLGTLCLRGAWLVWASGHVWPTPPAADLRPASSEDALPTEAPVVPADPSPDPDASHA